MLKVLATTRVPGLSARICGRSRMFRSVRRKSVITLFLLTDLNIRLRPQILALKPGTRVVANTFNMGDWVPDDTVEIPYETCHSSWCVAHLWIVPAKVAGTYRTSLG